MSGPEARDAASSSTTLPPGQFVYPSFDRFGLGRFARRFPPAGVAPCIELYGDVASVQTLDLRDVPQPRVVQVSDFHCVTTWSVLGVRWSGWRFADVWRECVLPLARPADDARFIVFHGHDGYRVGMQLDDLLAADVLLADTLDEAPLDVAHGAPLRLVAPAHYGYKNLKHIRAIEIRRDDRHYRFPLPYPALMDHPRARVALEERVRYLPAWLIRPLYRALMPLARRKMRRALEKHLALTRR